MIDRLAKQIVHNLLTTPEVFYEQSEFANRKLRTANVYIIDTDMKEVIRKRVVDLLHKLWYGHKSTGDIFITDYFFKKGSSIPKDNKELQEILLKKGYGEGSEQLQI